MRSMIISPENIPNICSVISTQFPSCCLLLEIGWVWPEDSSGIMSTSATYKKIPAVAVNIQGEKSLIEPSRSPTTIPMNAKIEDKRL